MNPILAIIPRAVASMPKVATRKPAAITAPLTDRDKGLGQAATTSAAQAPPSQRKMWARSRKVAASKTADRMSVRHDGLRVQAISSARLTQAHGKA